MMMRRQRVEDVNRKNVLLTAKVTRDEYNTIVKYFGKGNVSQGIREWIASLARLI